MVSAATAFWPDLRVVPLVEVSLELVDQARDGCGPAGIVPVFGVMNFGHDRVVSVYWGFSARDKKTPIPGAGRPRWENVIKAGFN